MVVTALHINCITQPTFAVKLILSKHLTDIAPLFLGSFGAMNSTYAFTMIQYLMKMCVKRQLLQRIQNLIAHNPGAHRKCLRRNTLISEKKDAIIFVRIIISIVIIIVTIGELFQASARKQMLVDSH